MISLVIAGSRSVRPSLEDVDQAIAQLAERCYAGFIGAAAPSWIREVVCGCATGGDRAGETWAIARSIDVHHEPITSDLVERYGKFMAPKQRNRRMSERGDAAIIFWDGVSNGSTDMLARMNLRAKPAIIIPTRPTHLKDRGRQQGWFGDAPPKAES